MRKWILITKNSINGLKPIRVIESMLSSHNTMYRQVIVRMKKKRKKVKRGNKMKRQIHQKHPANLAKLE